MKHEDGKSEYRTMWMLGIVLLSILLPKKHGAKMPIYGLEGKKSLATNVEKL